MHFQMSWDVKSTKEWPIFLASCDHYTDCKIAYIMTPELKFMNTEHL